MAKMLAECHDSDAKEVMILFLRLVKVMRNFLSDVVKWS